MFYRLNLLIIRHICLCCIAENINVNENISLKNFILITYIYIFVNL